jgi:hypothetical protein
MVDHNDSPISRITRMENGVGSPDEGWSWWISDREASQYREANRKMTMGTSFSVTGGTSLSNGTRYDIVFIPNEWRAWKENPQKGFFVPATREERLLAQSRIKAVMEYFGQPGCRVVLE